MSDVDDLRSSDHADHLRRVQARIGVLLRSLRSGKHTGGSRPPARDYVPRTGPVRAPTLPCRRCDECSRNRLLHYFAGESETCTTCERELSTPAKKSASASSSRS